VTKTGVPEDASGKTSFVVDQDLQPTTRFHWRARLVQGSTVSEWSVTGTFKSKLVGFLRAGELYDPLIHGEAVGTIVGDATFIPGKGLKLNSAGSFVRYRLPETLSTGEFSMEVEGLRQRTREQDQGLRHAGRAGRLHHERVPRGHPVSRR
jgi:hypothetical protein